MTGGSCPSCSRGQRGGRCGTQRHKRATRLMINSRALWRRAALNAGVATVSQLYAVTVAAGAAEPSRLRPALGTHHERHHYPAGHEQADQRTGSGCDQRLRAYRIEQRVGRRQQLDVRSHLAGEF
jgi:hypothetical protein